MEFKYTQRLKKRTIRKMFTQHIIKMPAAATRVARRPDHFPSATNRYRQKEKRKKNTPSIPEQLELMETFKYEWEIPTA